MSGDFLSRWSRRKREVRQAEAEEVGAREPDPTVEPEPPGGRGPAERRQEAAGGEPAPETLAALPPVEALTAETDITAFLREGVPHALRNAALRRMWSLDPAIRDYVGEACEYAYDWNAPGGVPGNGPLLPTDHASAAARGIFGKEEPAQATGGAEPQIRATEEAGVVPGQDDREPERGLAPPTDRRAEAVGRDLAPESPAPEPQALPGAPDPVPPRPPEAAPTPAAPSSRLRRHGGAMPV